MPINGQRKAAFRETTTTTVNNVSKITYSGEKNDKGIPEGLGTELFEKNKIVYQGAFKDGKRHGIGIYYENGIIHKVQYDNGNQIGLGTITYPDGGIYKGQIKDYEPVGFGVYTNDKIVCKGFFEKGGKGLGFFESSEIYNYNGELKNFKPEGLGCNVVRGSFYCGNFTDNGIKLVGRRFVNHIIRYGTFRKVKNSDFYNQHGLGVKQNKESLHKTTIIKDEFEANSEKNIGIKKLENSNEFISFKGSEKKEDIHSQDAKDFEIKVDAAVRDAISYSEKADAVVNDAKKKVGDADAQVQSAETVAKTADDQVRKIEEKNKYDIAKAAATPENVDFNNVGVYEFSKEISSGKNILVYLGTLKNGKPYGFGTIRVNYSNRVYFQGSFVDDEKMLGVDHNKIKYFFFINKFNNKPQPHVNYNFPDSLFTNDNDISDFITKAQTATKKAIQAQYDIAKAAATPENVDFNNVGLYHFPKDSSSSKNLVYLGTLKNGKPYGFGTIQEESGYEIYFQGSFVDDKKMLGVDSNKKKDFYFRNKYYNTIGENFKYEFPDNDISDFITKAQTATKKAIQAENTRKQEEAENFYKTLVEAEVPKHTALVYGHVIEEGQIYEGGVNNSGKPHGLGKLVDLEKGKYEGTFNNGMPDGLRKYTFFNTKDAPVFGIFGKISCTKSQNNDFQIQNYTENKTDEFIDVFKKKIETDVKERLSQVEEIVKNAKKKATDEAITLYNAEIAKIQSIIDQRQGGLGTVNHQNGAVYKGDIENGKANGYGKTTFPKHAFCEGVYEKGEFKFGKYVLKGGKIIYGFFENYKLHGFGNENGIYSDTYSKNGCQGKKFDKDICGRNKALIEVIKEKLEEDVKSFANHGVLQAQAAQTKFEKEERENIQANTKPFDEVLAELKTTFQKTFDDLKGDFDHYIKNAKRFDEKKGQIENSNAKKYTGQTNENGLPHGLGEMILKDNLGTYTGQFHEGVAKGFGEWILSKGNVYTGEFKNGGPNGSIIWKNDKIEYKGDALNYPTDLISIFGFGTIKSSGNEYVGEFKGPSNGFNHIKFANNDEFEGWYNVRGASPNGFGIYTYANGDIFKGFMNSDQPSGMGILIEKSTEKKLWSKNFGKTKPKDADEESLGIYMEELVNNALSTVMNTKTDKAKKATLDADAAFEKAKNEINQFSKVVQTMTIENYQNQYDDAIQKATITDVPKDVGVLKNYKGNVKDGKAHGYGVLNSNGNIYSGSFVEGEKNGLGKEIFNYSTVDWKEYIGLFKNNDYDGFGKVTYKYANKPQKYGKWRGHGLESLMYAFVDKESFSNVAPELEEIIKTNIEQNVNAVVAKAEAAANEAAANEAKKEAEKKAAETEAAAKKAAETEAAAKEAAENIYKKAIEEVTPKIDDRITVGEILNKHVNIKYFGHVKDKSIWYGYGKLIISEQSTFTGSFVNSDARGFGKIEFGTKSDSPLKEYYGFFQDYKPFGMGLGILKENNTPVFHTKWTSNTFEKETDDDKYLLEYIKTHIQNDAEKFVKEANKLSSWGLKEYGLATAAAGLVATGLYYAYNKYKQPAKLTSKKRSDQKRSKKRSKKRSNKQSDHKQSDHKQSDHKSSKKKSKKSSKKRSKKSSKKSSKKRSDESSERSSENLN